jgi:hypothetical protein
MQQYNKALVATVTAVLTGLSVYYGSPEWLTLLINLAGAVGVYQIPNRKQ